MKGTEKQVKWAAEIREAVSAKLEKYRGLGQDKAIDLILAQEDSRFWIDSFGRNKCAALADALYVIAKVAAYLLSDITDRDGNKQLELVFDPEINLEKHFESELEKIYRNLQLANRRKARANK